MGYCGSGGSGRRKALMDKFQQFLENIDESRAVCPESPCGNTGPCASFGHTGHTHPGPVSTFNPPRAPDYLDPNKRPLITNIQVKEFRPTSDLKALRMQSGPEESVWLKEMEDLPKWEDRFRLHPVNPKIVQRVLANKEKGYPPPGEKSPYLYRSPQPKPKVLQPRTFPPECMHHRGEVPCKICDPPFRHGYPECPQEEDISKICPAHWSAPCGHQALGQAAGCPPIQSYPRNRYAQ
ncbi:uncharacterized protein [Periplaneta americana]|uniref:uncharacterized protein isoform X4 n=1 Tax=Periplaneta americana TaxID=6978 RepID=UPI0037E96496